LVRAQVREGGVVVEDDVDRLVGRNLALDSVRKANEFDMAVALHAAADDSVVEHAEGGEQGGGAMPLVVMGCVDDLRPARTL
jgi:hypothetical protein